MKKKTLGLVLGLAMAVMSIAGCGLAEGGDDTPASGSLSQPIVVVDDNNSGTDASGATGATDENTEGTATDGGDTSANTNVPKTEGIVFIKDLTPPEGYVYSELTGELIDASIANQRPLAVMVDNEITALDHFGVNDCDIVYECMNSTKNGRITRLMCIIKDYDSIEQLGSVRSARTVNMLLSAEWNAILCHDGGPFYINDYYSKPEISHLNGVFSRVNNGKATEFTEYVLAKDVDKYLGSNAAFDTEYNKYYTGTHFEFVESNALDVNPYTEYKDITLVQLPYPHNSSELRYNESTGLYEYYEYGSAHKDGATGKITAFRNVIIQCADYQEYDENGYLYYKIENNTDAAFYLTDGQAVPIQWFRGGNLTDNTNYIDYYGNPVVLNAGKTYITLVPKDVWSELVMK